MFSKIVNYLLHLKFQEFKAANNVEFKGSSDVILVKPVGWQPTPVTNFLKTAARGQMQLPRPQSQMSILAELTFPWEDRMEESNALKCEKYTDLTLDLRDQGYDLQSFAIEVIAQGLIGGFPVPLPQGNRSDKQGDNEVL